MCVRSLPMTLRRLLRMNPMRRGLRARLSALAEAAPLPHEPLTMQTHLGRLRVIPSVADALIPPSHHMSWPIFRLVDEASLRRDGWRVASASGKARDLKFNRDNLERYSNGRYCRSCSCADSCPLEGSYDALESQLFAVSQPVRSVPARGKGKSKRKR